MSSGTKIIENALRKIGAFSIAQSPDPGDIVVGMDALNSMLQLWLSQGVDMGIVPLESPGDEVGEPMDATEAITDNLAILLAPNFVSATINVSQTLRDNARLSKAEIKRLYRITVIPDKVVSSTLPRGAGNTARGNYWNRTYFRKGEALDSSDS